MALSNYLFQSLIASLIFTGYGLGLYGRVGPALEVWPKSPHELAA